MGRFPSVHMQHTNLGHRKIACSSSMFVALALALEQTINQDQLI